MNRCLPHWHDQQALGHAVREVGRITIDAKPEPARTRWQRITRSRAFRIADVALQVGLWAAAVLVVFSLIVDRVATLCTRDAAWCEMAARIW